MSENLASSPQQGEAIDISYAIKVVYKIFYWGTTIYERHVTDYEEFMPNDVKQTLKTYIELEYRVM